MIYLTTKEVADIRNCSERHIQAGVTSGMINAQTIMANNNRKKYLIPLNELTDAEQLKYYKSHAIPIPEDLLPERKSERPHKEFDEFSATQREEIAEWIRILNAWDEYCATSKLQKVPATEKFVQLQKVANPDLNISKGILYRKKKALKADDLENHSYTDKVVSAIWRDERYTNKQTLLDDAKAKLAVLAVPEQSYTAKVIDLAKTLPDTYGDVLAFDLYDIVTLIDRKRKTRINHRIVEIKEYPADATLNTVTLSTVPAKVTGKLQTLQNKVTALDAQTLHDHNKVNEIKQDLDTTVLHVSDSWASSLNSSVITQTAEGLFFEVNKVVGSDRWGTLLQQSADDIKIAWNKISNYIKFENSQLNVYNSQNTKLMSLSSTGHDIFGNNGKKLMSLNSVGQNFYYKGTKVGYIGTGCYASDTSKRDLSFNLENGSAFMDWCYRMKSTDSSYTLIFTYAAQKIGPLEANQLHTGCDLNLRNHYLHNAILNDWGFKGGSITDTFSGYYVTSFNSDGTAATWKEFKMTFKNGILQSLTA